MLNVYIIQFHKLFLKPQYKKERRLVAQLNKKVRRLHTVVLKKMD